VVGGTGFAAACFGWTTRVAGVGRTVTGAACAVGVAVGRDSGVAARWEAAWRDGFGLAGA
jgi:hypothetical protein